MNAPLDALPLEPERYEMAGQSDWEVSRREFFRVAGAGLAGALLLGRESDAQPPQRGQRGGGGGAQGSIEAGLGINSFLRSADVREIPVGDDAGFGDLDTPQDYDRLRQTWPGIMGA